MVATARWSSARRSGARSAARFYHVLLAYSSLNGAKGKSSWPKTEGREMEMTYGLAPLGLLSQCQQRFIQGKYQR